MILYNFYQAPSLELGLISNDPVYYFDISKPKRWMFDTYLGYITKDNEPTYTVCKEWEEKMNLICRYRPGDIITILLEKDGRFSVAKNGVWVRGIFTDLPETDLWLVVYSKLQKISISDKGMVCGAKK